MTAKPRPLQKYHVGQEVEILIGEVGPNMRRQLGTVTNAIYLNPGPGIPRGGWYYRIDYEATGDRIGVNRFEHHIFPVK